VADGILLQIGFCQRACISLPFILSSVLATCASFRMLMDTLFGERDVFSGKKTTEQFSGGTAVNNSFFSISDTKWACSCSGGGPGLITSRRGLLLESVGAASMLFIHRK